MLLAKKRETQVFTVSLRDLDRSLNPPRTHDLSISEILVEELREKEKVKKNANLKLYVLKEYYNLLKVFSR